MTVSEQIISLLEEREVMWHGTTSLSAEKILKQGFLPSGKRLQRWDAKEKGLASYTGNYFTRNLRTAIGAAGDACRTFGGSETVIEVQVETRTSFLDEDLVPEMGNMVVQAFQNKTKHLLNMWGAGSILDAAAGGDKDAKVLYEELMEASVDLWMELLLVYGRSEESVEAEKGRLNRIRPLLRRWAQVSFKAVADIGEHFAGHRELEPEEYREIEQQVLDATRGLPSVATGGFSRNVRVKEPFSFKGSNRILSVVVLPFQTGRYDTERLKDVPKLDQYGWLVVYGSPSQELRDQYSDRMTRNFSVKSGSFRDVERLQREFGFLKEGE